MVGRVLRKKPIRFNKWRQGKFFSLHRDLNLPFWDSPAQREHAVLQIYSPYGGFGPGETEGFKRRRCNPSGWGASESPEIKIRITIKSGN